MDLAQHRAVAGFLERAVVHPAQHPLAEERDQQQNAKHLVPAGEALALVVLLARHDAAGERHAEEDPADELHDDVRSHVPDADEKRAKR